MLSNSAIEHAWPYITDTIASTRLIVDRIEDRQTALLPDELHLANGVSPARLRELQAGRAIARSAILSLGGEKASIQMTPSGAPVWPTGYCGSLSHTNRHVATLVALSSHYDAVGIDVDDGRPLGDAVSSVATADELELVRNLGPFGCGTPECLIFSIKEALFKCQYPLTGDASLEFLHVRLVPGNAADPIRIVIDDPSRQQLAALVQKMQIHIRMANEITTTCVIALRQ